MAFKFNPFTGKLDIAGGGSGGGGTVTSITAGTGLTGGTITTSGTIAIDSTVVVKDANNNISANAFFNNLATIAASGTQVVLTAASAPVSLVTGSGGQTIKLPDATTLTKGTIFSFNNNQSSGAVLVNNNSNTLVVSIPSGGYVTVVLLDNATAAGTWDRHDQSPSNVSWSTNTFDYPGSITSATWNGNTVAANRGGTGQSSPFVAGGIAYGSTTSALGVTPIGTAGQVLTSAGAGTPTWTTPATGTVTSVTATSPITSSGGSTPVISTSMATNKLLGRSTAATGVAEEIAIGTGLSLSAGTLTNTATITTGAVDNAILRADGTGGATLQNSDINIDDATTSTQNNVAITNQHSGQTNSSLVLTPKGTGAFILGPKPDGAASGGNARGTRAVDLQLNKNNAAQVASGNNSFIGGGLNNTASSSNNVCAGGSGNTCGGQGGSANVIVGGSSNQIPTANYVDTSIIGGGALNRITSSDNFIGGGRLNDISGTGSVICGGGAFVGALGFNIGNIAASNHSGILAGFGTRVDRLGMQAHANGQFSTTYNVSGVGDAQRARFVLRCKTTTNTGVEMALDGATTYLTIPSGKYLTGTINIAGIKSDGSATASYIRQFSIKNVSGTTTLVGTVNTIGIDTASLTSISITANDASDFLSVQVTGILSETWRWVASVDVVEVAYGT
jgi:hypothetical protein